MQWGISLFLVIITDVLHTVPGHDLAFVQLDDLSQLNKLFHLFLFAIGARFLVRA